MSLDNHQVAVCTTTYYPGWENRDDKFAPPRVDTEEQMRGDLALMTMKTVIDGGYQLLVVDGGSPDAFRRAVIEVCGDSLNFHPQKERGLGPSRHQAFSEAGALPGVEVVAFTLAEKLDFARRGLKLGLEAFDERALDMMLVGRASLDSLPNGQAASEHRCHKFIDTVLNRYGILSDAETGKWDWYSGFHIFRNTPEIQEILARRYAFAKDPEKYPSQADANPDFYSNALYIPLVEALDSKGRIKTGTMKVDYRHPEEMKAFEEADAKINAARRRIQRNEICNSILHFTRLLKGKPSRLTAR